MDEEEAAQLYERRAAELKRLDLCGRRPFPRVGRPTLQSLYENALILQVGTGPDSTKHITDKTVLHRWKRGMSVVADVQEVFAFAGHAVIETIRTSFCEESDVSELLDTPRSEVNSETVFGRSLGIYFYRHHVEPRAKPYVPSEESFPIPLEYIGVVKRDEYDTGCVAAKPD